MCGIFGIVKPAKDKVIVEELRDSLRNLAHRGPDGSSVYIYKNLGLGHQRLAIFDTSDKGLQPMSAFGLTISFNGAIYNFPEIRDTLRKYGYRFSTQTDTEVILAAYHYWGKDCVEKFNGQWAFAIHDKAKEILFCSRDRFGIKPFYYTWINGGFYFASEIKAFIPVKGWKAIINSTRAAEYLVHQMHDHTTETFFENVSVLEKGHNLTIDLQKLQIKKESYYSLDNLKPLQLSDQDAIEQFKILLEDSIRLRLQSDVRLGAALSGGLDSSSIVLSIPQLSKNAAVNTFSIVYDQQGISEQSYLDAVLKRGDFRSTISSPDLEDFKKIEQQVLWHQEEPINGFGVFAQHQLFETAASKGIKVMLDGQGADEILAGYEKFFFILLKSKKTKPIELLRLLKQINSKHQLQFPAIIKQFFQYRSKSKPSLPSWLKLSVNQEQFYNRPTDSSISETSKNLIYGLGLGALLRYEDKNAMAFGIESRVPYLDHRLVEFCLSIRDDLKIRGGVRKWIQRESMKDRLPDVLYKRYDKLGFATPQDLWLEQQRVNYLKEISSSREVLEGIIDLDSDLERLDSLVLWRIAFFGKWRKKFFS